MNFVPKAVQSRSKISPASTLVIGTTAFGCVDGTLGVGWLRSYCHISTAACALKNHELPCRMKRTDGNRTARSPVGTSDDCVKCVYCAPPLHVRPAQSVSPIVAFTCGSMVYGGVTGAAGSCSVWNDCTRTDAPKFPQLALRPASCGSVFCDVTAMRSEKSAK